MHKSIIFSYDWNVVPQYIDASRKAGLENKLSAH